MLFALSIRYASLLNRQIPQSDYTLSYQFGY